jgi:hypothetical protein
VKRAAKLEWHLHRLPGSVGSRPVATDAACFVAVWGADQVDAKWVLGQIGGGMDMRRTKGEGEGTRGMERRQK